MNVKRLAFVLLVLSTAGCGALFAFIVQFAPQNKYVMNPVYESAKFTDYAIGKTVKTQSGVMVDTSGQEVDLAKVDQLTAEFEACTGKKVERSAFILKIAPDWRYEECAARQLFPCKIPSFEKGCEDQTCPCGCAGILQWPSTVISTPNLAPFKHELVHLVFGIVDHSNPWFAKCQ